MPDPVTYEELREFVKGVAAHSYNDARDNASNLVDRARALAKRDPSSRPHPTALRRLRAAVAKTTSDRPSLSEFLTAVSALNPALEEAVETANVPYSGDEGRETLPIADWGLMLCFGWYSTETRKHVVEWAYLS
jgi:hypothetical protein